MAVERQIPFYIKSRSPNGLRRLMLQTNNNAGLTFHYFDIQFVNGYWFAWFYKDVDMLRSQDIEEISQEDGNT